MTGRRVRQIVRFAALLYLPGCASPTDAPALLFNDLLGSWQIEYTTLVTANPVQAHDSRTVVSCDSMPPGATSCVPRPFYLVLDTAGGQSHFAYSGRPLGDPGFFPAVQGAASLHGDSLTIVATANGSCCDATFHYAVAYQGSVMRLTAHVVLDPSSAASLGFTMPPGAAELPATSVMHLRR